MATSGAVSGIRYSLHLLLGEIAGYLLAIYAVRFVVGPLIEQSPTLATALKVAVAIYIIYLAIMLWRRRIEVDGNVPAVTLASVFVTTLLNPKAVIFAVAIFPLDAELLASRTLAFCVLVAGAGGAWIALGSMLRKLETHHVAYIPRIAALLLTVFAGFILLAR